MTFQNSGNLAKNKRLTKFKQFLRQSVISFLLCIFLAVICPLERFDRYWSDLLLARQSIKVPDKVVLVSITPEDVLSHGVERLSRKYLASTLRLLSDAGVARVLLDFNMARMSTAEEEAEVLEALKLFGPSRIGFAYESTRALRPAENIRRAATVLNMTLNPDNDGRIRSIECSQNRSIPNPCIWLSSGKHHLKSSAIDLRYDPRTITRASLAELHAGKIPLEQLKDSRVVIAHNRELSRTRATLPLYGSTDRGTILVFGTASCMSGYSATSQQALKWMSIFTALMTMISFYVGYNTTNIQRILIGLRRVLALVIIVCCFGTIVGGIPTKPASLALNCFAIVSVSVADRLKVFELFKGLLSGVLSPEEVWLWRTYGDRSAPTLLFDAMGYIKKANAAALSEMQLDPQNFNREISQIAKDCMPSLGERRNRLILSKERKTIWEIEWPSRHLPIALFTNITDQQLEMENLQLQVTTDPLTGALNRKGFSLTIQNIDAQQPKNYTVFFMDMNGFKGVNDRYGHAAGDILLKVTAQRFKSAMSPQDHVARFGGDEFAILIPRRLSLNEALAVRDRIESTLIERIDVGEALVQVGVAAGFAIPFDDKESTESILDRADHDMYQRKMLLKKEGLAIRSEAGSVSHLETLHH